MPKQTFFVAGTDTDVGKTLVTSALLHLGNEQGLKTLGLKPIAAGCENTPEGLRNDDASMLEQYSAVKLPYAQRNPIALEQAIAPHIAAANSGKRISVDRIEGICRGAMMTSHDLCLIEGAGGWRVPLNQRETMADIPKALSTPVILVVGIRLGCLNHALLTAEAIRRDTLQVAGWVANIVDPDMAEVSANIDTLGYYFPFPLLGTVPFEKDITPVSASKHLDISKLLETPSH